MGCANCRRKRAAKIVNAVPAQRRGMRARSSLITAAQFNEMYEVGEPFRYYPVRGDDDFVETRTRSMAWELGDGTPVVLIEGRTGGVWLEHLRHLP